MKYVILIIDGAAGRPITVRGGRTSLELARTPNLDAMAAEATLGLVSNVPPGMEPSSACACMSVMGYDPIKYYKGRASIEALSLGINVGEGEVVFRCNLVTVKDGKMFDYSAGHIDNKEAGPIITDLNKSLGNSEVQFFPGVGYRHILKIKGHEETLLARCTPPHDIPGKPVDGFLPQGEGSDLLRDLMSRSETILRSHKINVTRQKDGRPPVTTIWLFWGSGQAPAMPAFKEVYGMKAAVTSGVDLLRGLAKMASMDVLEIKGVTDAADSDHGAQVRGALEALREHDLVIIHIEAPDEAGHGGSTDEKVEAIEKIDGSVVAALRSWQEDELRVLVLPDHPTPIEVRTHTNEPVPFMIWGQGVETSGAKRFTETEAAGTGLSVPEGYKMMERLTKK